MMPFSILGFMNAGNRFVQAQVGESVTIASAFYVCTVGAEFTIDLQYETGGAVQFNKGSILVNKQDLVNAPARGTIIQFRGNVFRVTEVDDVVSAWEIHAVQLSA